MTVMEKRAAASRHVRTHATCTVTPRTWHTRNPCALVQSHANQASTTSLSLTGAALLQPP